MDRMNFDEFERDLLKRNKGRRIRQPRVSSWGLIFGIFVWAVIALGAALVSGAHSVPAILQTIPKEVVSPVREALSLFGFTIFELLIFAGAVYRRDNRYASGGLILAFVGALAANLGSSVLAVSQNQGSGLDMTVAVILATIAPSAAFLAGEMVHRLFVSHREKLDEAFEAYDSKRLELDKWVNKKFTEYEREYTKIHEPATFHQLLHETPVKSGEAPKPRVKLHVIAKQVHENGDANLSASDMMAKYDISLGSTTKIREMLKGQSDGFIQ